MYTYKDLHVAERFTLYLHRERLTTAQAAERFGVDICTIRKWVVGRPGWTPPLSPLRRITLGESIFIARRRLHLTERALATLHGMTPARIRAVERTTHKSRGRAAIDRSVLTAWLTGLGWPGSPYAHG